MRADSGDNTKDLMQERNVKEEKKERREMTRRRGTLSLLVPFVNRITG